jgi:hypothetical protein
VSIPVLDVHVDVFLFEARQVRAQYDLVRLVDHVDGR